MLWMLISSLLLLGWLIWRGFFRRFRVGGSAKKGTVLRVTFLHPDFGIGGAENLIVNAACALQKHGHHIKIFTAHHDVTHCFEETRGDGPLASCIRVYGDWLPRTIGGKMYALCAFIRMVYLSIVAICTIATETDVFFIDQVSIPIPLLRMTGIPVLFYCHFPDKMLCTQRSSVFKRLYRFPLDFLEEITTGVADRILVNSLYTASIFRSSFRLLSHLNLQVLYPPVNVDDIQSPAKGVNKPSREFLFVSLNRFERKKNIQLAIHALICLKDRIGSETFRKVQLVVAGGYDPQNQENVQHLEELKSLAADSGLCSQITFLKSISNEKKLELLFTANAIIYTPRNEHFGIVPVEAMCAETPVIAVSSGGPKESIVHEETGFLCEDNPQAFAEAMQQVVLDGILLEKMGVAGKRRVIQHFSLSAFASSLDTHIRELCGAGLCKKTD